MKRKARLKLPDAKPERGFWELFDSSVAFRMVIGMIAATCLVLAGMAWIACHVPSKPL